MSEEKKENLNEKWEKWRKGIENDIKGIKESVSSQNKLESPSFESFITDHVPGCPECQGILEKAGYKKEAKKEEKVKEGSEKKKETSSEKGQKKEWSSESLFSEEEK